LSVGQVIAKINDPLRARAYAELGLATLCRTGLMIDALNEHLGFPPSGLAGMLAPTGHHPGPGHDHPAAEDGDDASAVPAATGVGSQILDVQNGGSPTAAAPDTTQEA
ncbi:MAG TPA: hypothetical protein VFI69_09170, partial [Candidatus Limnocylindrales bacterium]|nr:hypothetical protein [Candidatus Limnocylindrales bacterium]